MFTLLLFNIVLEVTYMAIRNEKKKYKVYPSWKGRGKIILFADGTILYIQRPKVFIPKLSELTNSARLLGHD